MNVLPLYLQQQVEARLLQGHTLRWIAGALSISKGTVERYSAALRARQPSQNILCQCGLDAKHRGWCSVRFARSTRRQEFIARWNGARTPAIVRLKSPPRLDLNYPFLPPKNADNGGVDLLLLVNGLVPKGLPEQLRGDVCQDIIVAVLAGELAQADIPTEVRRFIRGTRKNQEADYMAFSIDAPRKDGGSWHDVLSKITE